MTRSRHASFAALLLVTGLALTSCSSSNSPAADATAAPTTVVTAPQAPRVGACYRLSIAAALRTTNAGRPVDCAGRHTSVTIRVGRIDPVVKGHLLAIDSTRIQRQVAERCTKRVDDHVGGSLETQRLSRIQAVWFSPTLEQSDRGALWYRCDLVIAGSTRAFAPLPRKTKGLLEGARALDTYGTCGTASPAADGFERVLCGQRHTWRARATIALPAGTTYLAKAAGKRADATCRDLEIQRSPDSLKLRWSFEWPTRAQWKTGQRYGLCWTPS
ncbi:MAG: hypothetical protein JWQ74_1927 [Marmoricola sp.]|nr:hypothetical protein [Marmoricola sp.]